MKIFPRCLTRVGESTAQKAITLTASGYLVPCCWCDNKHMFTDFSSITQEKFHISNIDSPEEVLESKEWKELIDTLLNNPKKAPYVCQRKCSSEKVYKEVIISVGKDD